MAWSTVRLLPCIVFLFLGIMVSGCGSTPPPTKAPVIPSKLPGVYYDRTPNWGYPPLRVLAILPDGRGIGIVESGGRFTTQEFPWALSPDKIHPDLNEVLEVPPSARPPGYGWGHYYIVDSSSGVGTYELHFLADPDAPADVFHNVNASTLPKGLHAALEKAVGQLMGEEASQAFLANPSGTSGS